MHFRLLAAGLAALVLQGCSGDAAGPEPDNRAQVRLASASPDAGALDLLIRGRTIARRVGSTQASRPVAVETGPATGEVRASNAAAVLATVPLTLEAGRSYTVVVAGPRHSLMAMVSVDTGLSGPPVPPPPSVDSGNPPPPAPDYARFRIVHAAPHAPPLDPYLQPADVALDTVPAFLPFAYGSLALIGDMLRPAGDYTVAFTEASTRRVVLDSGKITATVGELLTVVLGENADRSLRVDVVRE